MKANFVISSVLTVILIGSAFGLFVVDDVFAQNLYVSSLIITLVSATAFDMSYKVVFTLLIVTKADQTFSYSTQKHQALSSIEEKDVFIIEDSPAVGILLKEFLNKLGLKKIHHFQNGKTGIESFKELVEAGKVPLVFFDYNLPDMTGYSIMTQMLTLRPDIKVIIETAREKSEDSIKDVIAQGAYQYLPKPIRLENIKQIIETLKTEA